MARASLKSVALAAGVSVSSVSNAYNRPEQLSGAVRERILAVAREQGYAGPDAVAASLRNRRAGAIGVILTSRLSYAFDDPFTVEFLAGLTEIAEQYATGLTLIPFGDADADSAALAARRALIDAVIAYAVPLDHPALRVFRERGLPIASTSSDDDGMVKGVNADESAAAIPLGRLIRDLGHRRVAIALAGTLHDDSSNLMTAEDVAQLSRVGDGPQRLAAMVKGLGDDIDPVFVMGSATEDERRTQPGWQFGGNSRHAGLLAGRVALDLDDPPTAIMAATDVVGLGVMDALRERGLEPGVDVAVTGYDGIREAAAAGLTTVEQPIRERGRLMARMLLDPDFTERRIILPTQLVVRSSTAPPRS